MARIPQTELERLKSEISVERLVEAAGVVLKPAGKDLLGRCPFHEDREASLVVTPAKNLWHCFACQIGGGPIDWMMKAKGVSFRHAVELLREGVAPGTGALDGAVGPVKGGRIRVLAAPVSRDADDQVLLAQAIDYYHERLKQSPEALAYLERRGLKDAAMLERFKIGFADRTLGLRLPEKTRKAGAEIRSRLQKLGLWRASGHEHFNGSIVIPVIAPSGEITEVYGRKINDKLREGTPYHLYLPGPHRGVWNELALGVHPEVILCEALIDALTFWCAGFHNVTASYGVEGFTADHLSAFKRSNVERVLIAYDRDETGDRAAEKLSQQLLGEGLDCYRIQFPRGMDANEYALKVGPAAKSLGVAIRSAQWLGRGERKPPTTAAVIPTLAAQAAGVVPPPLAAEPLTTLKEAAKEPIAADPLEVAALPAQAVLPARAVPEAPRPAVPAVVKALGAECEYTISFADRRYRVRGLEKNASFECLKVNVLIARAASDGPAGAEAVHVDTLDLYQARARAGFARTAAIELGIAEDVLKADLGKLLLALESEQERLITAAQTPPALPVAQMSGSEREAALTLLRASDLIERIAADFKACGIVGERTNALVGYLCAISRKLERPLALLIQSTSAAGKSSLLDAVLRFVPEEDRIVYSAMTGQSLYYMGEMNLKHKLLAIAEEEGAHRASYALKLLQSEGELTIASTLKDPTSGRLATEAYHVEGPVMIALTTTAAEIDEELLNRCLVLSVDEGREQTAAIHAAQRERRTLAGLTAHLQREERVKCHQNAQRLLEPLAIVNPYAHRLTFLDDRTRTRRDHEKYLTLIDAVALLHQQQRQIKTVQHGERELKYIEVTLDDIALANALAHEVLGRTLDELPPQTRRLLTLLVEMVERDCAERQMRRADYRFSRRQVREVSRWGDTQLKVHLARLVELEYLIVHRGGRGQSFEYELVFDGAVGSATPHVNGLIDIETLRNTYDAKRSGSAQGLSGAGRGAVGRQPAEDRSTAPADHAGKSSASLENAPVCGRTLGTGNGAQPPSYMQPEAPHA